jgi:hypothetical protein
MANFLQVLEDGSRRLVGDPGWYADDGHQLTDEELVAAGYGLLVIDDPTPYDPLIQTRETAPLDQWPLTDTTATVVYIITDIPVEDVRATRLASLTDKRWSIETGGIVVDGDPIRTDEISQAKITGAAWLFDNDPDTQSIDWEGQPGVWITADAAKMKAIATATGRHVQACFSRERTLSEELAAAPNLSTLLAIDIETGWPPNA